MADKPPRYSFMWTTNPAGSVSMRLLMHLNPSFFTFSAGDWNVFNSNGMRLANAGPDFSSNSLGASSSILRRVKRAPSRAAAAVASPSGPAVALKPASMHRSKKGSSSGHDANGKLTTRNLRDSDDTDAALMVVDATRRMLALPSAKH